MSAKRAGVPWGKKVGGNTFHWCTRRTGAIRLLRTGTSSDIVSVVQAIGGWKDSDMLLREYNEVTQDEMRAAIEKLHGVVEVSVEFQTEEETWVWILETLQRRGESIYGGENEIAHETATKLITSMTPSALGFVLLGSLADFIDLKRELDEIRGIS